MENIAVLFVSLALTANAQQLNLTVSPSTVASGGMVTATLTFIDSLMPSTISALEWNAAFPTGVTVNAGNSLVAVKILSCNGALCILAGTNPLNNTAITNGPVTTFPLLITAPPGAIALALSKLDASSALGIDVPITSTGATLTVTPNKFDLNGDGVVDINDVLIEVQQVLGIVPCTNGDLNGDAKCGVPDLVLEIRAVLGLP